MRDLITTARRFLETHKTVRGLQHEEATRGSLSPLDATRLLVFRGAAQALAWTLEIDGDHLQRPPSLRNLPEAITRVRLHRIEVGDLRPQFPANSSGRGRRQAPGRRQTSMTRHMWLAEIPAHHDLFDPDFSTESWSCFLSDQQAYDLYLALGEALIPFEAPAAFTRARLAGPQRTTLQSGQPGQQPGLQPATRPTQAQPDTEDGYAGIGARRDPPPEPPSATAGAGGPSSPSGPSGPGVPSGSSRLSVHPRSPREPRSLGMPQRPPKGA